MPEMAICPGSLLNTQGEQALAASFEQGKDNYNKLLQRRQASFPRSCHLEQSDYYQCCDALMYVNQTVQVYPILDK